LKENIASQRKKIETRIIYTSCKIGEKMTGIFEIYVQTHFSAAHSLRGYPGDCSRTHGHNWIIDVFVKCKELDGIGIGIDFRDIKKGVKDVLKDLDHFNLNELPAFKEINPTSENIARLLYRELGKKLNSDVAKISKIKVSETPGAGAFYWEE
jgi:6-pyruvoyltetrahydropterin/6-carboxytetrahydropterin synthase